MPATTDRKVSFLSERDQDRVSTVTRQVGTAIHSSPFRSLEVGFGDFDNFTLTKKGRKYRVVIVPLD